jgi:hypothetical protein
MSTTSHTLAAGAGTTFGAALAGVIAGTWHVDPATSANWVVVLGGIASATMPIVIGFMKWRWPQVDIDGIPIPQAELVPDPGPTVPVAAPVVAVAPIPSPPPTAMASYQPIPGSPFAAPIPGSLGAASFAPAIGDHPPAG